MPHPSLAGAIHAALFASFTVAAATVTAPATAPATAAVTAAAQEPAQAALRSPQDRSRVASDETSELRIFRIRHQDAGALRATLREFLREDHQARLQAQAGAAPSGPPQRATVVHAHAESNSLIVSGARASFPMIERLISELEEAASAVDSSGGTPATAATARFVPRDEIEGAVRSIDSRVLTFVRLKHLSAGAVAAQLRPFLSETPGREADLRVGSFGDDQTVLLQGVAPRVLEFAWMLDLADAPSEPDRETQVVRLEHVDANPVASSLNVLFAPQAASAGEARVATAFRAVAAGPDKLLLTGPDALVRQALDVTARLDVEARGDAPLPRGRGAGK